MTTLAELVYQLEANTEGLNKAFPALEKMIGSLDALTTQVLEMGKTFQEQMNASARSTQTAAATTVASTRVTADALERQALAADAARRQMIDLNATLLRSGASADIIRANTQAFNEFNNTMRSGELTSIQFAQARAQFNNTLADSKREVALVNQAEKEAAQASSAVEAALLRQSNAVERTRLRYLDLSRSLERSGASAGELRKLESGFAEFENIMKSGVLSSAQYSTAQNKVSAVISEVKRAGGSANPLLAEMNAKFTELSKAAQFALGPLSGVASRIGVISSLTSRIGPTMTAAVAGFVAFGVAIYESVTAGAALQTQLLRIDAVLDATGNTIGLTTEQVAQMAEEVAHTTAATEDASRNAAAALLGIKNVSADIFKETLLAAQGLSLIARGDIETQMRRLGRVMEDPMHNLKALTESGIRFNATQERTIQLLQESGDIHGAQAVVLDRLKTVMAAATSESVGLQGAWKNLVDTIHNLFEEAGTEGSLINYLTDTIKDITREIEHWNSASGTVAQWANTLVGLIRGLVSTVKFLIDHIKIVESVFIGLVAGGVLKWFASLIVALKESGILWLSGQVAITAYSAAMAVLVRITGMEIDKMNALNNSFLFSKAGVVIGLVLDIMKRVNEQTSKWHENLRQAVEVDTSGLTDMGDRFKDAFDFNESKTGLRERIGDLAKLRKALEDAAKEPGKAKEAFDRGTEAILEFAKAFAPEELAQADATAALKRWHDEVLSASTDMRAKMLESVHMTEEGFQKLSEILDHLQTDLQKFVSSTHDDAEAAKANIAISGALGSAKQKLIIHEQQLAILQQAKIVNDRAGAEAVLANAGAQNEYTKSLLQSVVVLNERATASARAADTVNTQQQVDVARMQLSLVRAGTDAQNKQVAILQKKQEILQAGRDVTAEELALTGELVDLQNSIDHEKDIKALEDQVALQDKQMHMFTLTKNQREDAIALQQKEIELTNKYGSLVSEQAQREEELYKQTLATNRQIEGMNNIMDSVESGFDDAFMAMADYLSGTEDGFNKLKETASKALHDIAAEILKTLVETPIKNALFGALGAGLSGGSSPLVPVVNPFDAVPGGLPTHHAMGGMILPGDIGIVGENGPELVYGGADGASITPMSSRRGGGLTVNVYPAPGTTADATQRSDGSLDVVVKLIDQKISSFNRQLPRRVAEINRDPRLIG